MIVKKIKILHKNLNRNYLSKIIKLKKKEWKYSFKSQKKWIKNFFSDNDIHILVFINRELVGYTGLRLKKILNNIDYYYFDTHVVLKKFRGVILKKRIKVSDILMKEVFKIQKKTKKLLILLSKKTTFKYYKYHNWKKIPKKNYQSKKNLFAFVYPEYKFNKKFKYLI